MKRERKSKAERARKPHYLRKAFFALILIFLASGLIMSSNILSLSAWHDFDAQKILGADRSLTLLDSQGRQIALLAGGENRVWVSLAAVPKTVQYAFVSAEDARFYKHEGIDIVRIGGALLEDIKSGAYVQGASTISQQLIKLSHLTPEKTMRRKIEEAILAYTMEKQFSKDEIMEMYLNYVYFGGGYYGIETAAQGYFGVSASELTCAQGAQLAGILKSPSKYSPHIDLEASLGRRNSILLLMKEYGYLNDAEYSKAKNEQAVIVHDSKKVQHMVGGYYVPEAIDEACRLLKITKAELLTGGYTVHTAMNTELQSYCEQLMSDDSLFPEEHVQGAIAIVSSEDGSVAALVGGRNPSGRLEVGYNRAVEIRRQPGSVIKPLICYAPAIEYFGYTAASVFVDEPKEFDSYAPKNYGDKYYGAVTLRRAIAKSLNIPAVEVLQSIGIENGKRFASSIGIEFSETDTGLALALGGFTYGVSPLAMASAYSMLSSGGSYSYPSYVRSIVDASGRIVYLHNTALEYRMSESNAYILTDMLSSVINEGTGRKLGELGIDLAGKTGTVGDKNGNRDAWMAVYNSEYSVAVWLGCDSLTEPEYMEPDSTGGNYPALILKALFERVYPSKEEAPIFTVPEDIIYVRLDAHSILTDSVAALATPYTPDAEVLRELFVRGTEPTNTGEYFSIPLPPDDVSCSVAFSSVPVIAFTPLNDFTVYRLCRLEEDSSDYTVLKEFCGDIGTCVYADTDAPRGVRLKYYVLPVHPTLKLHGDEVVGACSRIIEIRIDD